MRCFLAVLPLLSPQGATSCSRHSIWCFCNCSAIRATSCSRLHAAGAIAGAWRCEGGARMQRLRSTAAAESQAPRSLHRASNRALLSLPEHPPAVSNAAVRPRKARQPSKLVQRRPCAADSLKITERTPIGWLQVSDGAPARAATSSRSSAAASLLPAAATTN